MECVNDVWLNNSGWVIAQQMGERVYEIQRLDMLKKVINNTLEIGSIFLALPLVLF